MSSVTDDRTAEARSVTPGRRSPRLRRVLIAAAVVVLVTAAGAVAGLVRPFGLQHHPGRATTDNAAATSTATVTQGLLSSQTNVNGTLGYAGVYTVLGQLPGTITGLPAAGQVIRQGQVLYKVNGAPVVLLSGSVPAYRSLAEGAKAADVTGQDVQQLNADLVGLGYASRTELDPSSDEFSWATKAGVEKLQAHLGVKMTGKLELGQVVFLPTAARVTSIQATLGGQASGPVLKAAATTRQVTVNLDAALQSKVRPGDKVKVTLPDNRTVPGRITSVAKVAQSASSGSSATVEVHITLARSAAARTLDQAPVQVSITTARVREALAVPVSALLARAHDGYAVEVVTAASAHHLVPVSLGLFDDADGLVQVTGAGLAAGQHVVVPAS